MLYRQEAHEWHEYGGDSFDQTLSLDSYEPCHHFADWDLCDCWKDLRCQFHEFLPQSRSFFHGRYKTLTNNPLVEYASQDDFSPYNNYVRSLTPLWIGHLESTSGQWFDYPLFGHSAVGVKGIYGCTVVIIISEKGVYLSHIWENPVFVDQYFNSTDDNLFTANTFNALRDGTAYAQSVTALIGTDQTPGVLHAVYAPKVFVLTPFTTHWDWQKFGISTTLRYQSRAEDLAHKLAGILPGSGGKGITVGYKRTSWQASSQESGVAGRAILEVNPFQMWLTTPWDLSSAGLQLGRWCLWVEDQLITYQDFWLPHTADRWTRAQQGDIEYVSPYGRCISPSSIPGSLGFGEETPIELRRVGTFQRMTSPAQSLTFHSSLSASVPLLSF